MLSISNLLPGRKTKEQEKLRPKEALEGIPIFNTNAWFEEREDPTEPGMIVVQPTKKTGWRRMAPGAMESHFKLDELGTFVVNHIDGKTKVRQIIELFQQEYQVNRREAELSVVQFLKMLMRKNIVSMAMK